MHLLANVSRQYRTLEPGVVPVQPAEDWFAAPPEHSSRFLPVYGQISLALQAAMRRAIRHALDTNPQLAPEAVLPAHVYLAGKIFQPKSKTEIAWDAMNPAGIARFFRSTAEKFPAEIEALQPRVAALNLAAMSVYFRPERARKLFESVRDRKAPHRAVVSILAAETALLDVLIGMAIPDPKPSHRSNMLANFDRRWRHALRRAYPGLDMSLYAQELLDACTAALRKAKGVN